MSETYGEPTSLLAKGRLFYAHDETIAGLREYTGRYLRERLVNHCFAA
jgi:hypothetical protein